MNQNSSLISNPARKGQSEIRVCLKEPEFYIQKDQVDLLIRSADLNNPYTKQKVLSIADFESYCAQRYFHKHGKDYYEEYPNLKGDYDFIRQSELMNAYTKANTATDKLATAENELTHITTHFWIFRLIFVVLVILGIVGYCNGWLENVALREEAVSSARSSGYNAGYIDGETDGYGIGYRMGYRADNYVDFSYISRPESTWYGVEAKDGMAWIPTDGGSCYHTKSNCSGMHHPIMLTLDDAEELGFSDCGKCY